jgi:hypothetical protein
MDLVAWNVSSAEVINRLAFNDSVKSMSFIADNRILLLFAT